MSGIAKALADLRQIIDGIAEDLSTWPAYGPRLIDEIEAITSVLMAIVCAPIVGAHNGGWAAFSGYMVMRSHVKESFRRGALRVAGTAVGAALAWGLSTLTVDSPCVSSAVLAMVGFITLYFALGSRQSYAWLFAGLTFSMVVIDSIQHLGGTVGNFAWSRFIEVLTGTCVCVFVSAVSTQTVRRRLLPPPSIAASKLVQTQRGQYGPAAQHALQGAIALAMIPWMWRWFGIQSLSQSSITIMAVMMVPLASLTALRHPTSEKLIYRFMGCCVGGLFATLILITSHDSAYLMTIGVCAGVAIGRHIENGKSEVGYIGTQFALAFLVVLVPDSYRSVDIGPGLDRLFGIVFGMLLLEPVRLVWRRAANSFKRE